MKPVDHAEYGTQEWFEERFADAKSPEGDAWGHRWRGSQKHRYSRYLRMLSSHLTVRGQTILDIGCALGDFTTQVAELHPEHQVVGVDISKTAADIASELQPHVQFVAAALPHLPFRCETFGLVMALEVINYLDAEGREKAFTDITRILRPDGLLLFSGVINQGTRYFDPREVEHLLRDRFIILGTCFNYARLYGLVERTLLKLYRGTRLAEKILAGDLTHDEFVPARLGWLMRINRARPLVSLLSTAASVGGWVLRTILENQVLPDALALLTHATIGARGATHVIVLGRRK